MPFWLVLFRDNGAGSRVLENNIREWTLISSPITNVKSKTAGKDRFASVLGEIPETEASLKPKLRGVHGRQLRFSGWLIASVIATIGCAFIACPF